MKCFILFTSFQGVAELDGNPFLEVLYFIDDGNNPSLKVGLLFKEFWLHKVVNQLYEKEAMQISWMKFDEIGNL